jgi:hypothetical protein
MDYQQAFAEHRERVIRETAQNGQPTRRVLNDNVVMFDLDGCVSNDSWRRGRIPEGASKFEDYQHYHDGCGDDPLIDHGARLLEKHIVDGDFITFTTARPFNVAEKTAKWISNHFKIAPVHDFMILMRQDNDGRSAVDIKREFVNHMRAFERETGKKVIAAYDDRIDIIDMYREAGLNAAIVNEHGYFPAQSRAQDTPSGNFMMDQPAGAEHVEEALRTLHIISPEGEPETPPRHPVARILEEAAETFDGRNSKYRDNAVKVGRVMEALFPDGVNLNNADDFHIFHLFELMIVKLTRFVNSDLTHQDSIRDMIVYGAMVENLVEDHNISLDGER